MVDRVQDDRESTEIICTYYEEREFGSYKNSMQINTEERTVVESSKKNWLDMIECYMWTVDVGDHSVKWKFRTYAATPNSWKRSEGKEEEFNMVSIHFPISLFATREQIYFK